MAPFITFFVVLALERSNAGFTSYDWGQCYPNAVNGGSVATSGRACNYTSTNNPPDYLCYGEDFTSFSGELLPNQSLNSFGLCGTAISTLRNNTFKGSNITLIKISHNQISVIEIDAFNGLIGLKYLSLEHNKIKLSAPDFYLPFRHLDLLEILHLADNKINMSRSAQPLVTLGPVLPSLRELRLSNNPITFLDPHIFEPLANSSLTSMALEKTSLTFIQTGMEIAFLKVPWELIIISFFPGTFSALQQLKSLTLDFTGWNPHSPSISTCLGLNNGKLSRLDLSSSNLNAIPFNLLLEVQQTLTGLDLSNNFFSKVGGTGKTCHALPLMPRLEVFKLSNCMITDIEDKAFKNLPSLIELNLKDNEMNGIPKAVLLPQLQRLSIGMKREGLTFELPVGTFRGMSSLRELELSKLNLINLDRKVFRDLTNITRLVIDQSSIETVSDYLSSLPNLKSITLTSIPNGINVSLKSFQHQSQIETLDLSGSKLTREFFDFPNDPEAYPLQHLQHLNLQKALVDFNSIPELQLHLMPDLKYLNLSDNILPSWESRLLFNNPNLTYFAMAGNGETILLTQAMIFDFRLAKTLDLSRNTFFCNQAVFDFCRMAKGKALNETDSAPEFAPFIVGWDDGDGYFCSDMKNGQLKTFNEAVKDIIDGHAGYPSEDDTKVSGLNLGPKIALAIGSFFVAGVILLSVHHIQANWWYIKYKIAKQRILNRSASKSAGIEMNANQYDAFVSYCSTDKDWLEEELMYNMEEKYRLKLCIHERDFQVGSTIIENIVLSLEHSRGCIIVLSEDYVASDWCNFEAQVTHHMFQNQKKPIVVVIPESFPESKMSKSLRFILKTRTYIEWKPQSQDNVWKRVLSALETN